MQIIEYKRVELLELTIIFGVHSERLDQEMAFMANPIVRNCPPTCDKSSRTPPTVSG